MDYYVRTSIIALLLTFMFRLLNSIQLALAKAWILITNKQERIPVFKIICRYKSSETDLASCDDFLLIFCWRGAFEHVEQQ